MNDNCQSTTDHDLTKHQKILMTATELFIKNGYANVTTDKIAKNAGVSKGLIYHHFISKDDLAYEVFKHLLSIDSGMDQFEKFIQIVKDDAKSVKTREFIHEFIKNTLDQLQSNPSLSLLFMDLLVNVKNEAIKIKIKNFLGDYLDQLIDLMREMGVDKPEVKARIISAIIDGLGFQFFVLDGVKSEVTIDDFVNEIMQILE